MVVLAGNSALRQGGKAFGVPDDGEDVFLPDSPSHKVRTGEARAIRPTATSSRVQSQSRFDAREWWRPRKALVSMAESLESLQKPQALFRKITDGICIGFNGENC